MVAGAQQPLLTSLQCPRGHRSLVLVRAFQTKGGGGLPAGGRQILFPHKLLLTLGSVGRTRPRPFCVNGLTR